MNLDKKAQSAKGLFKAGNCYFQLSIEKMLQKYGQEFIQRFRIRLQNQTLKIRSAVDYIQKPQFWEMWKLLLEKMIICDMKNVYASYSIINIKILKQVRHIQFSQLICLQLNSNSLTNVETLYMIKAPNLKYIWLNNNRITSFKTISKSYFYNLEQIHLQNNCFYNQVSQKPFMTFKNLKNVCMPNSLEIGPLEYEISGLIKFQTKKLKIKLQTKVSLNQGKVKEMLIRKCIQQ